MEQSQNLLVRLALEIEQVFNCINIEGVPFKFETCRVVISGGTSVMKSWLNKAISPISLEHAWIQQIINLLIINL